MYQVSEDTIKLFDVFSLLSRSKYHFGRYSVTFFSIFGLDGKGAYHCTPMNQVSGGHL